MPRGSKFSVDVHIRQPVLPLFRLLFISGIAPFSHGPTVITCPVEVIRSCILSLDSLLFSDIFCLLSLFVSIKVLRRSVTYDWIHSMLPSNPIIVGKKIQESKAIELSKVPPTTATLDRHTHSPTPPQHMGGCGTPATGGGRFCSERANPPHGGGSGFGHEGIGLNN